jgi:hypothetical protein
MPYDPLTAAQKARFVQFAYNMYSSAPDSLRPAVDPALNAAGFELVQYLDAHDFQEVKFYGYLAASTRSPGQLILAIRGTVDVKEWLLDFGALPLPYLGKGFVAAGFRSIAESFQFISPTGMSTGDLATAIATRNAATPIKSISILGHSLGGALATLAAAQIAFSNPGLAAGIELWTYASPRVALPDFMTAFSEAVPNAYRIWNTLDIVPQVPTFPYTHIGQSEELKQSQAQIEELKVLPACEHHLTTYQWLLDPSTTSPDTACQITAPAAVLHEGISPVTGARLAPVSEEAIGAAALAQALRRHP